MAKFSPTEIGEFKAKNASFDQAEEVKEDKQRAHFESLVQAALGKYRNAMNTTKSITRRDLAEYEENSFSESKWVALGAETYDQRSKFVRESINKYIPEMIQETRSLESQFLSKLDTAKKNGWIGEDSARDWMHRLTSENWQHWEKAEFMTKEFPAFYENWKKVAEEKDNVLALAKKKGLTAKEIPELNDLLNKKAFLSFHYHTRMHKVSKAKALVLAYEKNETPFLRSIEKELEAWAHAGILHASKVGKWMQYVMESENPQKFVAEVLYPYKKNWEAVRKDFDDLNEAMDTAGVPRGFRPVSEYDFLLMEYKQRTSYCALGWLQLEDPEGQLEMNKELAALKLDIRYHLNTEDWEEADEKLEEAFAIDPEDRELLSMRQYLRYHRTKQLNPEEQERNDPLQINKEMQAMVKTIPDASLQEFYNGILPDENLTAQGMRTMYNRVWLHEVAHWTTEDEQRHLNLQRATKRQHGKGIMLDMEQRETHSILRELREHSDSKGGKGAPNLDYKARWGYWATLYPKLDYAQHRSLVRGMNYKLKMKVKQLKKLGFAYSSYGPPQALN